MTTWHRPWLAFDVETTALPDAGQYLDPPKAPENYRDQEKIAAYIADATLKLAQRAALDCDLCQIGAIAIQGAGLASVDVRIAADMDEAAMLAWFWAAVAMTTERGGVLVGFNCLSFDLIVLQRRSLYLGVPMPKLELDRYRTKEVIDLLEILSYKGKLTWRSLKFYAKRFGLPYDDSVDGAEIPALIAAGKWEPVIRHIRSDVTATVALAQACGVIAREPEVAEVL